jgi:hypothetical protein
MASTQEALYNLFSSVLGSQGLNTEGLVQHLATGLSLSQQGSHSSDGLGSVVSTILKSAFGIVPLIGGLFGLFGGGAPDTPPPLTKYIMPESLSFQMATLASGVTFADYDASGAPRPYLTQTQPPNTPFSSQTPPITVNVQALDAQSFMDHSHEIAAAVREAMLNLSSINDVVNTL